MSARLRWARRIGAVSVTLLLVTAPAGCGLASRDHAAGGITRTVTDTLGRQVAVPQQITRAAMIGTVPVMISYVVTIGAQDTIVTRGGQSGSNGVGANGKQGFNNTEMYRSVAPNVLTATSVAAAIMAPVDTEALLKVRPDVVIAPNLSISRGAFNPAPIRVDSWLDGARAGHDQPTDAMFGHGRDDQTRRLRIQVDRIAAVGSAEGGHDRIRVAQRVCHRTLRCGIGANDRDAGFGIQRKVVGASSDCNCAMPSGQDVAGEKFPGWAVGPENRYMH